MYDLNVNTDSTNNKQLENSRMLKNNHPFNLRINAKDKLCNFGEVHYQELE